MPPPLSPIYPPCCGAALQVVQRLASSPAGRTMLGQERVAQLVVEDLQRGSSSNDALMALKLGVLCSLLEDRASLHQVSTAQHGTA